MKTAVVTGAGGFVGRSVVKELLSQGFDVLSIVHSKKKVPDEIKDSIILECGFEDYLSIIDSIKNYCPDVFYHFAWSGTSGQMRANEEVQLSNVKGTCNAIRVANLVGCRRFVFAASIMEYEVDSEIKSMQFPNINSIYSTAKLAADYMARILAGHYNLEYISAMISNIYGPGEYSPRLINTTIRKLLKEEHVSLSNCEQLYDFLYISDAAKMIVAVGIKGISGKNYYIGNRKRRPLKQFMEELRDIVKPDAVLGFGEVPFSGVGLENLCFDTESVLIDTKVEPYVTFSDGISKTRDWILKEEIRL